MIGRSIKCDNCNHVEILSPTKYESIANDGICPGWVRLFINKPYRYAWKRDDEHNPPIQHDAWYDLCSVSCATSVLYALDPK